jgi:hypothetical protein
MSIVHTTFYSLGVDKLEELLVTIAISFASGMNFIYFKFYWQTTRYPSNYRSVALAVLRFESYTSHFTHVLQYYALSTRIRIF